MIGSTKLVKHNFILEKKQQKITSLNFIQTFSISFHSGKEKDELVEILSKSHVSPERFRDKLKDPPVIITNQKTSLEKRQTEYFIRFLLGFARSPIRDFERYLRFVVGLDEADIHLSLEKKIQISSHMKYPQAFTQIKILQKSFEKCDITTEFYKLNMMM